jgi:hypothetical protein
MLANKKARPLEVGPGLMVVGHFLHFFIFLPAYAKASAGIKDCLFL